MMNKKGNLFLAILIGIVYFMAGMITYQLIKPDLDIARENLVCDSPTSPGSMLTCLVIDGIVPALVIIIFFIAMKTITEGAY